MNRRQLLLAALPLVALTACGEDDAKATDAKGAAPAGGAALRPDDLVIGDRDAPVTVLVFESLTCPHCATFHRTLWPRLKAEFVDTGKAAFVFRDMPLDGLAMRASAMARCLEGDARHGALEMMFARQDRWARAGDPLAELALIGQQAGLPQERALACANDEAVQTTLAKQMNEDAQTYGLRSTPSFVIGGELVFRGAPAYESFAEALNARLPG